MRSSLFRRTIFFTLAILAATHAGADTALNNTERLRRLSLLMRSQDISTEEWKASRSKAGAEFDAYFAEKTRQYSETENFRLSMIDKLSALYRVKSPFSSSSYGQDNFTSLHVLFDRVVRENRSWDELLTAPVIALTPPDPTIFDSLMASNETFFKDVLATDDLKRLRAYTLELEEQGRESDLGSRLRKSPVPLENRGKILEVKSPQVAGVLSDSSFLDRLPTTPVNQNRKRAAALFRIFLCDEMKAIILPDEAAKKEIEEAGLDHAGGTANIPPQSLAQRHADDPKCSACHYKLEPIAKAYKGVSNRMTNRPQAGSLTFKRRSGELAEVPFRNMQELAQALVKQPEYVSCQVRHFWDWFIGKDVPLTATKEAELVRAFETSGRRPKDFVQYLVRSNDFHRFPQLTAETIRSPHISGILRDCTSCHEAIQRGPSINKLPLSAWMTEKLVKDLDLLGDGSRATMPPPRAGWKLGANERALMIAWLANGAPGDDGVPQWQDANLRAQLKNKMNEEKLTFDHRPGFDFTVRRRLSTRILKNTADAFAIEIRGNSDSWNNVQQAQTRNLESGEAHPNPDSQYIQQVRNFANLVTNSVNSPQSRAQVRDFLGLSRFADQKGFGDNESVQMTRAMMLDIMSAMLERFTGRAPKADGVMQRRIERYVDGKLKGQQTLYVNPLTWAQESSQQVFLTTNYLTF